MNVVLFWFGWLLLVATGAQAGNLPYWYSDKDAVEHRTFQKISDGEWLNPTLDTIAAGLHVRVYSIQAVYVENISTKDTIVAHIQCTSEEQGILNVYTVGMTVGIVELPPGEHRAFILPIVDQRAIFIARRGVTIGYVDISD